MVENAGNQPGMQQTVGNYLYDCLSREGITEIFGVPGDYNFSLLDILEKYQNINFVNCRNELNAGYAADAYARIKGMGALITTFGVGELSACNAIAGSYCERVPVIHIVGAPKTMVQQQHKMMHHTLLDGDFDVFRKMYENISEYTAIVTPENAAFEIPTAIQRAKEKKKPVYMLIAIDIAEKQMVNREFNLPQRQTDQRSLQEALQQVSRKIKMAQSPVLLPDIYVLRYNLQAQVQEIAEKLNVPVATMIMGKGSFDEIHKNYIGLYAGNLGTPEVQNIVESSDCILAVGPIWSDYNTGSFTANINPVNLIEIQPDYVKIGIAMYENIMIEDMLRELAVIISCKTAAVPGITFPYDNNNVSLDEDVSSNYYYPRFQQMLKENDILIADAGNFEFGLSQLRLPKGAVYITQGGWGSIGYGTPAAFGSCMAAKDRRVLLFVGDGSHQMTTQEVSSMLTNGCKPIIFLVNNQEYTVEKYLNVKNKQTHYNDIPEWNYSKLLEAYGGDAYKVKVYTNRELDAAISTAEEQCRHRLCLIEIYAPKMDAPVMVLKSNHLLEEKQK
ncbi:MAG: thiamine pyrophosphate-binding protein [Bacillota bacterium]|nr:thiamine pyrophosphate-binding protein [Bacillota bacterium]